jgi:hypothetical protein
MTEMIFNLANISMLQQLDVLLFVSLVFLHSYLDGCDVHCWALIYEVNYIVTPKTFEYILLGSLVLTLENHTCVPTKLV